MPEYLAPGVYIEEVSFRSKSIEGVSTSTAAFVGPTRFGPPFGVPELLTSFPAFERIYGGLDELEFQGAKGASESIGYLAQGVRAFFSNGGQRLYVSRIYAAPKAAKPGGADTEPPFAYEANSAQGCARGQIASPGSPGSEPIPLRARYPGREGDLSITFSFKVTQNVLAGVPHDPLKPSGEKDPVVRGVSQYDLVWIRQGSASPDITDLYWADRIFDESTKHWTWQFHNPNSSPPLPLSALIPGPGGDDVRVVTVSVSLDFSSTTPRSLVYPNLTFHPEHTSSLSRYFAREQQSRTPALTIPLVFDEDGSFTDGTTIAQIMMTQRRTDLEKGRLRRLLRRRSDDTATDLSILATLGNQELAEADREFQVVLTGGSDGYNPLPTLYEGDDTIPQAKTGLKSLEDLSDVSIVAAPGYSAGGNLSESAQANMLQISEFLIGHCEKMRYRIGVLDSADGQDLTEIRLLRSQLDSTYAALYYPWVTTLDPVTNQEIILPPSGFVTGLYAENDILYGVHKAPANMVVHLAISFEVMLNKAQQDVLNPLGINCFRFFEGRGYRLWGARTISSDPEWKYVNLRRYFAYLEHSIDVGTQWAVFEPNDPTLWSNVQTTVEDFLYNEWKSGHLLGNKPEEAYFVRCDRTTMTQNDLDNGRMICLIGVAPVRPAEFVIFRIGQWTGTKKN